MTIAQSARRAAALWLHARIVLLLVFVAASPKSLAVPTCTVASSPSLSFGSVPALASTGDVTTNTGSSFWINCTSDVVGTPGLYSAGARTLVSGSAALPFHLSPVSPGGPDLPSAPGGTPVAINKNGTNENVPLYGKILAADFKALPSGVYVATVTLTIAY